jgi:transposase InsO family protein
MFATDSDNAHVFREILEKIGAITLLHSIGTPDDFLSVIGQTDSAPPYLVITGHGGEHGIEFGTYGPSSIDVSSLAEGRYLYVILDVFSRYAVGWTLQHRESASIAKQLISQAVAPQQIQADQLTIHADRGSSMRSKSVAFLLADLGMTKTHSRPYTSSDNP